MAKFKIGDRVECLDSYAGQFTKGKIYVVSADHRGAKYESVKVERDDSGSTENGWLPEFFKLAKTITIEPGKHYRLKSGKVTGRVTEGDIGFEAIVDGSTKVFDKAGGAVFGDDHIVEAWAPKVGERVRIANARLSHKRPYIGDEFVVERETYEVDGEKTWAGDGASSHGCVWLASELVPVAAPAQPAVWVPVVGDKVVWLEPFKASMYTKGKEYLIHKKERGSLFITDDNDNPEHGWSDENILRSFSLVVPLTIQAGRYYKTRDGRKVGPMEVSVFLPDIFAAVVDDINRVFQPNGTHGSKYVSNNPGYDLIAEWIDEPVTEAPTASNDNAAPAKFKVGDTVRCVNDYPGTFTAGKVYKIRYFDPEEPRIGVVKADHGRADGISASYFEPIATTTAPTAIVALIENGQPKPSERPFVHSTEAAAGKEASRLASLHKGKQFGVYVLASTAKEEVTYSHEWQRLAAKGEKINAIKELRSITGMGLKPAKDAVEYFLDAA